MTTPAAVLFDFDGVIADTENVHVAAWQRTLARIGWDLTDEVAARAAELNDRAFAAEVFARARIDEPDLDGWVGHKRAIAEPLLADAGLIYPGVDRLVSALRDRGARLAIVTTTWRRNVEIVLGRVGLLDSFERIVAKEDVDRAKPAPDGYALALGHLALEATGAVALEDSPTGIAAARAAGLATVAVGHRRARGDWAGESPYLADLRSIPDALAALGFLD